jgi:magnesium-transporting ATPase (P-type)
MFRTTGHQLQNLKALSQGIVYVAHLHLIFCLAGSRTKGTKGMETSVDVEAVHFWHADKIVDVVQLQQTDLVQGLSAAEVAHRIGTYGKNQLPEKRKVPFILRLWEQINNILIFILVVAAIVSAVLQVSRSTI